MGMEKLGRNRTIMERRIGCFVEHNVAFLYFVCVCVSSFDGICALLGQGMHVSFTGGEEWTMFTMSKAQACHDRIQQQTAKHVAFAELLAVSQLEVRAGFLVTLYTIY